MASSVSRHTTAPPLKAIMRNTKVLSRYSVQGCVQNSGLLYSIPWPARGCVTILVAFAESQSRVSALGVSIAELRSRPLSPGGLATVADLERQRTEIISTAFLAQHGQVRRSTQFGAFVSRSSANLALRKPETSNPKVLCFTNSILVSALKVEAIVS